VLIVSFWNVFTTQAGETLQIYKKKREKQLLFVCSLLIEPYDLIAGEAEVPGKVAVHQEGRNSEAEAQAAEGKPPGTFGFELTDK